MAKEYKEYKEKEPTKEKEMSLEEARKYRASLSKPKSNKLSADEKREAFRLYWAQEKYKYGRPKELEQILWLHLQAVKMDEPEKFENGLTHFGLKKI